MFDPWVTSPRTRKGGRGPRARDEQSGAVAERAHRCAGEYLSAARAADRQYSAPGTNPILDRLRSFGQTRGLAFGAYGEASPDVHALLTVAADGLAARQWRDMGARTQEEARSFIVSSLRRRLGLPSSSAASSHASAHPPGAVHRRAAGRRRAAHAVRPAHRRTAGASAALRAPHPPGPNNPQVTLPSPLVASNALFVTILGRGFPRCVEQSPSGSFLNKLVAASRQPACNHITPILSCRAEHVGGRGGPNASQTRGSVEP